jgi:hypothetical protein
MTAPFCFAWPAGTWLNGAAQTNTHVYRSQLDAAYELLVLVSWSLWAEQPVGPTKQHHAVLAPGWHLALPCG